MTRGYRLLTLTAAAAAALLAMVLSTFGPVTGHYETGPGGLERVMLNDGSTMTLNTDTRAQVHLSDRHRRIVLTQGEALFDVAHDKRRPFDVEAAGVRVRAVGTSFAVRVHDEKKVEVVVAQGRVKVDPQTTGKSTVVVAGQSIVIGANPTDAWRVDHTDVACRLAWTRGWVCFDHTTLAEAVEEINRYNRRKLVISDPSIAQLRVGGWFNPTHLGALLSVLNRSFGIRAFPPVTDTSSLEDIHLTGAKSSH